MSSLRKYSAALEPLAVPLIVVLVGVASFGLGRLAATAAAPACATVTK